MKAIILAAGYGIRLRPLTNKTPKWRCGVPVKYIPSHVKFDRNYIYSVKDIVDVFYYDLNVYKKNTIKTYPIKKCIKQIEFIKKVTKSIFIGGGVSEKNAHKIINIAKPDGLDISRSLKGKTTSLSNLKLKKFLSQVAAI